MMDDVVFLLFMFVSMSGAIDLSLPSSASNDIFQSVYNFRRLITCYIFINMHVLLCCLYNMCSIIYRRCCAKYYDKICKLSVSIDRTELYKTGSVCAWGKRMSVGQRVLQSVCQLFTYISSCRQLPVGEIKKQKQKRMLIIHFKFRQYNTPST